MRFKTGLRRRSKLSSLSTQNWLIGPTLLAGTIDMRSQFTLRLLLASICVLTTSTAFAAQVARPNIVWIIVEDMSADFACYGQEAVETPNVDRLASQGLKFTNAVVTAPVCSACRSALVTGMFQTTIGSHHHRSGRGELKIKLPVDVPLIPELLAQKGYHITNLSIDDFVKGASNTRKTTKVNVAKTDYNFEWNADTYRTTHWCNRAAGVPFFCQVQLKGGKLRGKGNESKWPAKVTRSLGSRTTTAHVQLPPYLPKHPVILEDWAQYLDTVRYTDWEVGKIVDRLKKAGELSNTYIFFMTDHGISHVRNKQFCYEGGIHVPLIVTGPKLKPGERTDVVEHIDLAATTIGVAGVSPPERLQGRDILAANYAPRKYAFSARDRCDETVDRIRSVRTTRYKYIRNQLPKRPYLQPNRYKDSKPILQVMRELHAANQLNTAQARIMADVRPAEELYDLTQDPNELNNLAASPSHAQTLAELRRALDDWIISTGDKGQKPEGPMYDSDMAVYSKRRPATQQAKVLQSNIALMKRWALEGK